MSRSHFKDIEASVTAVDLDLSDDGKDCVCVCAMCRIVFVWDGNTYEKEFGPIKERHDLSKLPQVGSSIWIRFDPDTGDCFAGKTKFDGTKSFVILCAETFAIGLIISLFCLAGVFLIISVPGLGLDDLVPLISLLAIIFFLIGGILLAISQSRFNRQLRDEQFLPVLARFTGKYVLTDNTTFTPVYVCWIEGRKQFYLRKGIYKRSQLQKGDPLTLYRNVRTGKLRQPPFEEHRLTIPIAILVFGGVGIILYLGLMHLS